MTSHYLTRVTRHRRRILRTGTTQWIPAYMQQRRYVSNGKTITSHTYLLPR